MRLHAEHFCGQVEKKLLESPLYSLEEGMFSKKTWRCELDLSDWNRANMMKLLWNLSGKADSLWIKWIHSYYIKNNVMTTPVKNDGYWIMKTILRQRELVHQKQIWQTLQSSDKLKTKEVYHGLMEVQQIV